jgi:hypothetical protein
MHFSGRSSMGERRSGDDDGEGAGHHEQVRGDGRAGHDVHRLVAIMRKFAVGAVTMIDADRCPVGVVYEDDLLVKETDPYRQRTLLAH